MVKATGEFALGESVIPILSLKLHGSANAIRNGRLMMELELPSVLLAHEFNYHDTSDLIVEAQFEVSENATTAAIAGPFEHCPLLNKLLTEHTVAALTSEAEPDLIDFSRKSRLHLLKVPL